MDRLDLIVGDVQRDHGDRAAVAVLEHAPRLPVDLDLPHPDHAELPADARGAEQLVRLAALTSFALDALAQLHLPEYREKVRSL